MRTIINFSHPITPAQIEQLNGLLGKPYEPVEVVNVKVQLDMNQPFEQQIEALYASLPVRCNNCIVNLPGFAVAAAMITAKIIKDVGHVTIMRLKSQTTVASTSFVVAELIDL